MTFIPSVLSKTDENNSGIILSDVGFNGTSVLTTGYNSIIISIINNIQSSNNGIIIQFSDDNINFETFFTDNYNTDQKYEKSYPILKKYYKISFINPTIVQPSTTTGNITTRLLTSSSNNISDNNYYLNSFNSEIESTKDAFNKLRVTNPFTLIDLKYPNDNSTQEKYLSNYLMIDYLESGTGNISKTFGKGNAIYEIEGDNSTSSLISQSRKYCNYQPGKSLLFLASCLIKPSSNTSTDYQGYVGYFDDLNGLFFKNDSGTISINLRSNDSGSPVDTTIIQNNWNIDTLDGNGKSGINLNFNKTQLFVIDFEWLGVGRIRFGFYINGQIYYCHQISNVNELEKPYMSTPNLPIRFQLDVNDNGDAKLIQICSTVISEGGYNPIGRSFSVNNGLTSILVDSTETNLLAITGNDNYYHHNIIPTYINIIAGSNDSVLYFVKIIFNGTDSSIWSDVDLNNSVVKYSTGSDINITYNTDNSIIIDSSYAIGKNTVNFNDLSNTFNSINQLTSDINNIPDIILISAQKVSGGSTDIYSSLSWQEVY
jgi:hypothetical protein